MEQILKYPRTPHLEGSGLQPGDEDLAILRFDELAGRHLVVEEKVDGANCGVSFDSGGRLRLQSRGHYLTGGPRERQFHLLKGWASRYAAELWELLGDRYVLYGEWCYGKHTIFYDHLPHYLMEFDLYDTREDLFLSTERRMERLRDAPFIASVEVLHSGPCLRPPPSRRSSAPPVSSHPGIASVCGKPPPLRDSIPSGHCARPIRAAGWKGCTSRSKRVAP